MLTDFPWLLRTPKTECLESTPKITHRITIKLLLWFVPCRIDQIRRNIFIIAYLFAFFLPISSKCSHSITSPKHQETLGFLVFSEGIEYEHWPEMT